MCGIVGIAGPTDPDVARDVIDELLRLSDSRGSEAAGVAVVRNGSIDVAKAATDAASFTTSTDFRATFGTNGADLRCAIGHTRMVTNGSAIFGYNNQPVAVPGFAMVHNGIVVNADQLWSLAGEPDPDVDVDSAALLARIVALRGDGHELETAVATAFGEINGSASIAVVSHGDDAMALATNNGSLYAAIDGDGRLVAFGSERRIVERFCRRPAASALDPVVTVEQIEPGTGRIVGFADRGVRRFQLAPYSLRPSDYPSSAIRVIAEPGDTVMTELPDEGRWRRCRRCILPETFPFIEFDDDGVCSQCHQYLPMPAPNHDALERLLAEYRKGTGAPDCVVTFSGGRDSSYGLHVLVEEFGMKPLVLTYDWGMVTDLARRNQARMVGQLGVEHVLISADIAKKRNNIQRNMNAWLARPELGMVPLLMAGDKQFFTHSARLARESGVKLVIFSVNPLEMTYFKAGFAGVEGQRYYSSGWRNKARLMAYYGGQFARNPRYLNRSLVDSASAFRASYFTPHDYVQLFEHIRWDEDTINRLLIDRYHWETDPSTPTTWRIGDGTAPFYNWVYFATVGFTENDTFRSNQIREGVLTRERALSLVNAENVPRLDRIREYLDLIDVSMPRVVTTVEKLADMYTRRFEAQP